MTMQAVLQTEPGGPETLHLGQTSRPQPAAGQLLVKVAAAGINRADLAQRAGNYPPPPGESNILGMEIAGRVVEVGTGVTQFAVGDRVMGLVGGGGYAEYCLLQSQLAIPVPTGMDAVAAASLPEAWMTTWFNLVDLGGLHAGQRVLIHAGASGIGSAGIQLCKSFGAWVAVTAGGPEKCAYCRDLGADMVIDYKQQDFATELKNAGGVDLILDGVGGDYLPRNQACLNADGQIILIGMLRGLSAEANMGLLLIKRQTLRGSTLRPQPLAVKGHLAQALRDHVLPLIQAGKLRVTVAREFDWTQVADAHRYVAAGHNLGKVILRVGADD